ncbi:MAG: hypothetical protein P8Y45_19700, partial [Exilibacterium sp.]
MGSFSNCTGIALKGLQSCLLYKGSKILAWIKRNPQAKFTRQGGERESLCQEAPKNFLPVFFTKVSSQAIAIISSSRKIAEHRKHKPPFCPSGEASYPKFPHSFTIQIPIFAVGPAQIALILFGLAVKSL